MNSVTLTGNLGADAELRYTSDGTAVCNCRLATHEYYKNAQGETQKKTEWHRVVVFGTMAASLAERLTKGRHVAVTGSLATHTWVDSQGVKRAQTQVKAKTIELGPQPSAKEPQPATEEAVAAARESLE